MSDPRITDEAVEAAEREYEAFGATMRDALEAALPLIAPVDREALVQLLDDYAVGRHIPEDAAQHRAFIADAVLALLNGGAK